jgi:hypothetical protein
MFVTVFATGDWNIAGFPAIAFCLWFLAMLVLPVRVVVGDDGLYAHYGFARFYVPVASIIEVERPGFGNEFHVHRRNKGAVIFTGASAEGERFLVSASRMLRAKKRALEPETVFARQGRSFREWADGVRGLVDEARGYREAHVPRERALSHLKNSALSPELRIGAALALTENATTEEKQAIDDAIAGVASPTLKRVLTNVTKGALEDAESAQVEFEEEAERAKTGL